LSSTLVAVRTFALRLASQHRASKKRRKSLAGGAPATVSSAREGNEVLQKHSWWWFDVAQSVLRFITQVLRPSSEEGTDDAQALASHSLQEMIEGLLEPCSGLLDLFEFMPSCESSELASAMSVVVQDCVVALASAADSAKVKSLISFVLLKTRSDDVEVRLRAIKTCQKTWSELGVQLANTLSETVMYCSELMEDEDARVEEAVRVLVKTIEGCTGESLQDALKR